MSQAHAPAKGAVKPSLGNPLEAPEPAPRHERESTAYDDVLTRGAELRRKPREAAGTVQILRQHTRDRMTVWERVEALQDKGARPSVLWQNWGPGLDGASIATLVTQIGGREVAVYGHDFTLRAGSMDATNGRKLANLIYLAAERGIPLVGMNDSAGAFVPAGVGGLDGYSQAFAALRRISGIVPSVMCMFGFNAGGGSYLPRQGSFMIQPQGTFFGLTGPAVVKSVLGEDVTPDELGGPSVHGATGVTDICVADEISALRTARQLLSYLPSSNKVMAPYLETGDPIDRRTHEIDDLLRKAFTSPTGFNTPVDVSILIERICDRGDYFELQPDRARNAVTAFGRLGGNVTGFVANNSAVSSGQIDVDAALKIARFVRFCSLYNIPVIFMEDTTGFLPGKEQESRGIVQSGRAMLDSIIDLRTPRILLIIRNAYGGAYAAFNSYEVGADLVLALPTTRVAVMGPAGKDYVYKDDLRRIRREAATLERDTEAALVKAGSDPSSARADARQEAAEWLRSREAEMDDRYTRELMNPDEALSLGSISEIVMPDELRRVLATNLQSMLNTYIPGPMTGPQREFH